MAKKNTFFTDAEEARIIEAIRDAERETSGEIKVHIEDHCFIDLLDRTAEVFAKLEMHKTELRNGALIYIALKDHIFAIIGDNGINAVIPEGFWDKAKDKMEEHFKKEALVDGIVDGIGIMGQSLKKHFPYDSGDQNELSDEISFG